MSSILELSPDYHELGQINLTSVKYAYQFWIIEYPYCCGMSVFKRVKMKPSDVSLSDKLVNYIGICNTIMSANTERFPYAHIWHALEEELAGRLIEYQVSTQDQDAQITAVFIDNKIRLINRPECNCAERIIKNFHSGYIDKVLAMPERYIANPMLIDWNLNITAKVTA